MRSQIRQPCLKRTLHLCSSCSSCVIRRCALCQPDDILIKACLAAELLSERGIASSVVQHQLASHITEAASNPVRCTDVV